MKNLNTLLKASLFCSSFLVLSFCAKKHREIKDPNQAVAVAQKPLVADLVNCSQETRALYDRLVAGKMSACSRWDKNPKIAKRCLDSIDRFYEKMNATQEDELFSECKLIVRVQKEDKLENQETTPDIELTKLKAAVTAWLASDDSFED